MQCYKFYVLGSSHDFYFGTAPILHTFFWMFPTLLLCARVVQTDSILNSVIILLIYLLQIFPFSKPWWLFSCSNFLIRKSNKFSESEKRKINQSYIVACISKFWFMQKKIGLTPIRKTEKLDRRRKITEVRPKQQDRVIVIFSWAFQQSFINPSSSVLRIINSS